MLFELLCDIGLALLGFCVGSLAGYLVCKADTEYYRTIVYAYEQQKTREMFK